MDESGSLQVYLCDPIIEEMDEDYGIDIEREYDVNGGQFSDAYLNRVMPVETIRHNLESEATIQ
jgi:hypothetical protein